MMFECSDYYHNACVCVREANDYIEELLERIELLEKRLIVLGADPEDECSGDYL